MTNRRLAQLDIELKCINMNESVSKMLAHVMA